MTAQTSMTHVRLDTQLKTQASKTLAAVGLTISDAVRILLTRVVSEGALPPGLTCDPQTYDAWFRTKVREALADPRPAIDHDPLMDEVQALIDKKHHARG